MGPIENRMDGIKEGEVPNHGHNMIFVMTMDKQDRRPIWHTVHDVSPSTPCLVKDFKTSNGRVQHLPVGFVVISIKWCLSH